MKDIVVRFDLQNALTHLAAKKKEIKTIKAMKELADDMKRENIIEELIIMKISEI